MHNVILKALITNEHCKAINLNRLVLKTKQDYGIVVLLSSLLARMFSFGWMQGRSFGIAWIDYVELHSVKDVTQEH